MHGNVRKTEEVKSSPRRPEFKGADFSREREKKDGSGGGHKTAAAPVLCPEIDKMGEGKKRPWKSV